MAKIRARLAEDEKRLNTLPEMLLLMADAADVDKWASVWGGYMRESAAFLVMYREERRKWLDRYISDMINELRKDSQ
jgi:hypothetical protein